MTVRGQRTNMGGAKKERLEETAGKHKQQARNIGGGTWKGEDSCPRYAMERASGLGGGSREKTRCRLRYSKKSRNKIEGGANGSRGRIDDIISRIPKEWTKKVLCQVV